MCVITLRTGYTDTPATKPSHNKMGLGKTEWEDILIEKGIIAAPKEATIEHHPDIIYDISNNELERDEVDELFSNDEGDDEFIQKYKEKRLQELRESSYFGSMTEISRNDFVAEVTETSKKHPVLVFLYQTANINCQVLARWLTQQAAPTYPSIKFVQIQSTRCIQNYPDANLPTILLYRLGTVQKQLLQADVSKARELIEQILEAEQEQDKQDESSKDYY